MENREQKHTNTHQSQLTQRYALGNHFERKHFWEKTKLEHEVALLSFVWNGNNANTKEKELSMELIKTCGLWDDIEYKFPLFSLSSSTLGYSAIVCNKQI